MSDQDETRAGAHALPAAALMPAQVYRGNPNAPRDASGQLIPHRAVTPADVAALVIEQAINGLRQGRSGHSATPVADDEIAAALEAGLDALAGLAAARPMLAHDRDELGRQVMGRAFARAATLTGSEERARYLAEGQAVASRRRQEAAKRAARGGR